MVLVGKSSDRHNEYRWHFAMGGFAAALGVFLVSFDFPGIVILLCIALSASGRWSAIAPFWGMATNNMSAKTAAGAIAMIWVMRREGAVIADVADSVAPAIPLAQAIGRWGNYFNQELYGRPTDLPWAVEISANNRSAKYAGFETFQPTFLYESLLNLIVVGIILWVEKRFKPAPGSLFTVYLVLYGIVRFLMELLRTDTEYRLAGISRNGWLSILAAIGGTIAFIVMQRRVRVTL